MRVVPVIALSLLAAAASADTADENVFEEAKLWTVQIRTAVDRAFSEDEQGSFFGAGLVVDAARGWVLTNAHVASHSYSEVNVIFRGERALIAERLYVDPYLDIAVVAYDPGALAHPPPEPRLECESMPPVGHPVGAFGHPWGFRFTGTRGIASAVTSRLGPEMLQTDAPINQGNSGGPLISLSTGRVVAVNAATMRKDRTEGLNFAVPMPYVCTILDLLHAGRDPSPPANLVDFASDEDGEQTLIVARSRLPQGSLALQPGDVMRAVGAAAVPLESETQLVDALRGGLADVTLTVERDGRPVVLRGAWPAAPLVTERQGLWISGALFAAADVLTAGQVTGIPQLMVHHVEPGSLADATAISFSDLLVSADGLPVDSLDALQQIAARAAAERRELPLLFLRIASAEHNRLFNYERRLLDASDLQFIGPAQPLAHARALARERAPGME